MWLSIGIALFALGHFTGVVDSVVSKENTVTYKDIQYEVISNRQTYKEAENVCYQQKGYLAKLDKEHLQDQADTQLSKLLVTRLPSYNPCLWIGFTRQAGDQQNPIMSDGRWFTGSPVTNVRWEDGIGFTQAIIACGMVCQERPSENVSANYWEWRHTHCDAKLGFVCQYGCFDCVRPAGQPAVQYKSLHYTVYNVFKTYAHAEHFCKWNGGNLAKITLNLMPDDQESPLSRLVEQSLETCVWIGMSDRKTEGKPVWFDGSSVKDVNWRGDSYFHWFTMWKKDCGAICLHLGYNDRKQWDLISCSDKRSFMCQYDIELVRKIMGTATNASTSSPKLASPEVGSRNGDTNSTAALPPKSVSLRTGAPRSKMSAKRVEFRKITGIRVTAPSLFQMNTMSPTMCSRLCLGKCGIFNFNVKTKQCEGFPGTRNHYKGIEAAEWDLWEPLYF